MKRVIICLLIALLLVPVCCGAWNYEPQSSGVCGLTATWTFNDQNGVLTISGTGTMNDFHMDEMPWMPFLQQIKTVVVEKGIITVGNNAFANMSNLTQVRLAEGLIDLGDWAFYGCSSLTQISLPDSVTELGVSVFENCSSLTEIKLPKRIAKIPDAFFKGCVSLSAIEIPENVTSIGGAAFHACEGLTQICLPAAVKEVGQEAFAHCSGLTSVTLNEGLEVMGYQLFQWCSLRELEIPETVRDVQGAFNDMANLEKITFLGHAPVGADQLPKNRTLTVYYPSGNPTWNQDILGAYGASITFIPLESQGSQSSVIARGTCGIGLTWALSNEYVLTISGKGEIVASGSGTWKNYDDRVKQIVIENGVTKIGVNAFYQFSALEKVTIANTVTEIERYSFDGCVALTYVEIPASVELLWWDAFRGCTHLEQVDIRNLRMKFDMRAFRDCNNLKQVNVAEAEQKPSQTSKTPVGTELNLIPVIVVSVVIFVAGLTVAAIIWMRKK